MHDACYIDKTNHNNKFRKQIKFIKPYVISICEKLQRPKKYHIEISDRALSLLKRERERPKSNVPKNPHHHQPSVILVGKYDWKKSFSQRTATNLPIQQPPHVVEICQWFQVYKWTPIPMQNRILTPRGTTSKIRRDSRNNMGRRDNIWIHIPCNIVGNTLFF